MNYVINKIGLIQKISQFFRKRHMRRFLAIMKPQAGTVILDVSEYHSTGKKSGIRFYLHLLNIYPIQDVREPADPPFTEILGEGCALQFENQSYDIIFFKSVIEHLGTLERQQAFAAEMMRVGKTFWIQTTSGGFFSEPHIMIPFLHYLPVEIRRRLIRKISLWSLVLGAYERKIEFLNELRLLSFGEMPQLFSGCMILR